MALPDIDWWDKAVTWLAAIVAAMFAWLGKVVYGNFQKVDDLNNRFSIMEANHEERREMITKVSERLDAQATKLDEHINATNAGFIKTIEKIDKVKDQLIEVIREVK